MKNLTNSKKIMNKRQIQQVSSQCKFKKNMLKLAKETGEKVTLEKVYETLKDMEKDPIISERIKKCKQVGRKENRNKMS